MRKSSHGATLVAGVAAVWVIVAYGVVDKGGCALDMAAFAFVSGGTMTVSVFWPELEIQILPPPKAAPRRPPPVATVPTHTRFVSRNRMTVLLAALHTQMEVPSYARPRTWLPTV